METEMERKRNSERIYLWCNTRFCYRLLNVLSIVVCIVCTLLFLWVQFSSIWRPNWNVPQNSIVKDIRLNRHTKFSHSNDNNTQTHCVCRLILLNESKKKKWWSQPNSKSTKQSRDLNLVSEILKIATQTTATLNHLFHSISFVGVYIFLMIITFYK